VPDGAVRAPSLDRVSAAPVQGPATPSPNIWHHPRVYERLNRAADPDELVAGALDRVLATGAALAVDVGCGSGFHLPMLSRRAARVVGVDPHPGLVTMARQRVQRARLSDRVSVRPGVAQRLPLPDRSADLVFSHWSYFFGPGCEPGVAEATRVLKDGGVQVVVDVDVEGGHGYPRWLADSAGVRGDRRADFFDRMGFTTVRLPVVWRFSRREDLTAVLAIEFSPEVASRAAAETVGTTLPVPSVLRWRRISRSPPAARGRTSR
jgi:SAM-dependent methyltransferase